MLLLFILQVAAVGHGAPVARSDSVALVNRAQRAQYNFIIDWRYQEAWDIAYRDYAKYGDHTTSRHFVPPPPGILPPAVGAAAPTPEFLRMPEDQGNKEETFHFDIKREPVGCPSHQEQRQQVLFLSVVRPGASEQHAGGEERLRPLGGGA